MAALTYAQRAARHANPAAKSLLQIIDKKKTNLCVSVDVTKKQSFLAIVEAVGPYICLVKTHIDIVEDFDLDLTARLQGFAKKYDFLIFEDRKFADIGNTVALQYSRGVHRISSWSHITNAHPVPGPGIISGLASVGLPLGRGLLLLAEMSSEGNLATGSYTKDAIRMARARRDFVIGFIAMSRESITPVNSESTSDEDFLILTPGVGLETRADTMGQQYRTPREVILERQSDVIIVGRGIYGDADHIDVTEVQRRAAQYREEGWKAYLERLKLAAP